MTIEKKITFYHREKIGKIMHVVYETLPHLNMKFSWYSDHFYAISLNVLVSFFHFQINFYKDGKSSPTHSNLRTGMRKILTKSLILAWKSFLHHMHYLYKILSMISSIMECSVRVFFFETHQHSNNFYISF